MTWAPKPCRGAWPLLSQRLMSESAAPLGDLLEPVYVHDDRDAPGAEKGRALAVRVNDSVSSNEDPCVIRTRLPAVV